VHGATLTAAAARGLAEELSHHLLRHQGSFKDV
jgi:hypothetical protein